MTFHSIVKQWCRTYRPMIDRPKNRRFYLADSWDSVKNMPKSIATTMSPCVVMENGVEGDINDGLISRNYPVYFFVRAQKQADADAMAEAYEEAWLHAQNFYTWLRKRHEDDPTSTGEYRRIEMEYGISVQPAGPLEDGWVAVFIQFTRLEQINLCVNEDLYDEDCCQ